MERTPHFFYALKLPQDAKAFLMRTSDRLRNELPFNRWVHEEDYHITLAFLGSATKEQLEASLTNVARELTIHSPFSLTIQDFGVFGKGDSPRIFWARLEKEEKLLQLRNSVYQSCIQAGFKLETREFQPHITLARKWQGEQPFSKVFLTGNVPFTFQANEIVLYETHVEQTPKYEIKESFFLNKLC
ncbi:RNA 2',3'-cyclic phosphodiesterase [Robertmurraya siralis]|uniref:RNA 2',3'-cyclic phosphodiesterase n=1 Tax=Robertmurraya siralis TaxID=77777 RepID=A0A919WE24_9BACI|nr:RNA 2',3'-cyclic phosphodiesterase [Robertmurraya siralis]PAE19455.1 RNA 2',3'-cyclic phosphodiesterase [Bacillus sp. 7504-2]GIN60074.1 RNA 2',3'-cyclic phosphodiesterase [Robertmurraya siralis]